MDKQRGSDWGFAFDLSLSYNGLEECQTETQSTAADRLACVPGNARFKSCSVMVFNAVQRFLQSEGALIKTDTVQGILHL